MSAIIGQSDITYRLPKMLNLNLILKKTSEKSKFYSTVDPYSSKMVASQKTEELEITKCDTRSQIRDGWV